jgi:hypothetical protein
MKNTLLSHRISMLVLVMLCSLAPGIVRADTLTFNDQTDQVGFSLSGTGFTAVTSACDINVSGFESTCLQLTANNPNDPLQFAYGQGFTAILLGENGSLCSDAGGCSDELLINAAQSSIQFTFISDLDGNSIVPVYPDSVFVFKIFNINEAFTYTGLVTDPRTSATLDVSPQSDTEPTPAVPEPGTISLMLLGGMALVGKVRRHRTRLAS